MVQKPATRSAAQGGKQNARENTEINEETGGEVHQDGKAENQPLR